jgi:hypothetical protein
MDTSKARLRTLSSGVGILAIDKIIYRRFCEPS